MQLDLERIRAQFPALAEANAGKPPIFFDNAAGTQVPRQCIDRTVDYYTRCNANSGGVFGTSVESDRLIDTARRRMADFLGATDPDEVAFGANMTTLTQMFARAFGRLCAPGDEIVTTRLEHEANVSPWLGLGHLGVTVRFADIDPSTMTIDLESLAGLLNERTRLVAFGYASNGFGTVNPVAEIASMAREAGALSFVDAVHYGPHGPIDVGEIGCDLLLCSVYKFFGPHVGVMWGRRSVLDGIPAYHLRTVKDRIPDKFETGTLNHEGIAGTLGALEYLESLATDGDGHAGRLRSAMRRIAAYERELSARMLDMFDRHPRVTVHGLRERSRLGERVPTFAVTVEGLAPRDVASRLAEAGINVWSGNYYALEPMTRIGLEERGGAVRISLAHYNTADEIATLDTVLASL